MEKIGLTFDDILLIPAASDVLPSEVSLRTRLTKKLGMNLPIISAAMDTVTEAKTAIAMARDGGIGIIHKNMPVAEQVENVERVKRSEYLIVDKPVTLSKDDNIAKAIEMRRLHGISAFPVVDGKKLVGIVTSRDMLFEEDLGKRISEIMTKDLITTNKEISSEDAKKILHKHRIEKLPIVNDKGELRGLITVTDIVKRQRHPQSNHDKEGRLAVGAAIGPSLKDEKRVEALVNAETDVIVIDTSHGHSRMVVDAVRRIKKNYDVQLIAGNVATAKATEDLIAAGADAVKVGVGPGTICTTRIISGVGVPQFTAVLDCSKAAEKYKVPIIADGGIRYSGDITKAIAAGASSVMIGSLFAGCDETPGRTIYLYNRKFKQYRGMGSLGAMEKGSKDRYFQGGVCDNSKLVPEGVEGLVPYKGSIAEVLHQLIGGLRSGMGLVGAKDVERLRTKTKWMQITSASLRESHPHDIEITEEAPNYRRFG